MSIYRSYCNPLFCWTIWHHNPIPHNGKQLLDIEDAPNFRHCGSMVTLYLWNLDYFLPGEIALPFGPDSSPPPCYFTRLFSSICWSNHEWTFSVNFATPIGEVLWFPVCMLTCWSAWASHRYKSHASIYWLLPYHHNSHSQTPLTTRV